MTERIKNKKTFNLSFIIKNINSWEEECKEQLKKEGYGESEKKKIYERRRDYDRIYKIINFFQKYSYEFSDSHNTFLKNNLMPKKGEKIGYNFSLESTVFYICLCENFKLKFFKNFINRKHSSKQECDEWLNSMFLNLNKLEIFYERNNPKYSWEDFKINIGSIINEFESINQKLINIEKHIWSVVVKFVSLSDVDKNDIYYDHMYSRFKYINNVIDERIKDLESYKYDKKYNFIRKLNNEGDKDAIIKKLKNINSNKGLNNEKINLINEYIDKENRFKFFELQLDYYKKISQSNFKYNNKIGLTEDFIEAFKKFNLEPVDME
ncbi:hypothetical protein ACSW8X_00420 [Clostridium perfringens]